MKTLQLFTGWMAISLALAAATAGARTLDGATRVWLSAIAVAQTSSPKATEADRREVEKLLHGARQAIDEGHFETADSLISRCEALKVDFGLFHVGDTPKRARHDLDIAKRHGKKAQPQKPGQKARPDNPQNQQQSATAPPQVGAQFGTLTPTNGSLAAGAGRR